MFDKNMLGKIYITKVIGKKSAYVITGYEYSTNQYIGRNLITDKPRFNNDIKIIDIEKEKQITYNEVLEGFYKEIQDIKDIYFLITKYMEIIKATHKENDFMRTFNKLREIAKEYKAIEKYGNKATKEKDLKKVIKAAKRRMKRLYHYLSKEDYDIVSSFLKKVEYDFDYYKLKHRVTLIAKYKDNFKLLYDYYTRLF